MYLPLLGQKHVQQHASVHMMESSSVHVLK